MARHKGVNFDKDGIIKAIQAEVERNPEQSAAYIAETVYRRTGTKPSSSYVGTIRSRTESYRKHVRETAVELKKEVERLDALRLKLQKKTDFLAEEARKATKAGNQKRADELFNSAISLLGPMQKANEMLRLDDNRLERLNSQMASWGGRPLVRKSLLSVLYDMQKWERLLEEARLH